ncbi:MAG: hypothetical protein LBL58_15130 [Tannerellaceae bacterium]|jgi:hypothetical protein|nr:hypothetical protein [Tannerellaceae bacterium]
MNKNENELDQLTRRLFTSASLEPSADLSRRIMERIAKEQPLQKGRQTVIHRQSWRFSPWLTLALVAYFAVAFLILYMYGNSREDFALFDAVNDKISYLLTVAAVFGSFPFFHTIDRALS